MICKKEINTNKQTNNKPPNQTNSNAAASQCDRETVPELVPVPNQGFKYGNLRFFG